MGCLRHRTHQEGQMCPSVTHTHTHTRAVLYDRTHVISRVIFPFKHLGFSYITMWKRQLLAQTHQMLSAFPSILLPPSSVRGEAAAVGPGTLRPPWGFYCPSYLTDLFWWQGSVSIRCYPRVSGASLRANRYIRLWLASGVSPGKRL